jgi:hypothetical protein
MSDLVVTTTLVIPSPNASKFIGISGDNLNPGNPVYLDPGTNTYKLCKANGASPVYQYKGISCTGSSPGQPVVVATGDTAFAPGCTVNPGDVLIVSGTITLDANKTSGWFVSIIGYGIGNNQIVLLPPATAPQAIP